MRVTSLQVVGAEPLPTPESTVARLVAALARHGFEARADHAEFCGGKDVRPCIPVFRFTDVERQGHLTDLVLDFYESTQIPERDRDTRLRVHAFDDIVDSEVEFDYMLQFDGAEVVAHLPRELFELTPDIGRSIEDRYCAKLSRFADYLEHRAIGS